jgi:hypothetical protein
MRAADYPQVVCPAKASSQKAQHGQRFHLECRRTARGSARGGDRHNARGERGAPATPLRSPMRLTCPCPCHALRSDTPPHRAADAADFLRSWCARAEQRYAKDPPLGASEVRALFTNVLDDILNRQLGYTDDETTRVHWPPPPRPAVLPLAPSPPHPSRSPHPIVSQSTLSPLPPIASTCAPDRTPGSA